MKKLFWRRFYHSEFFLFLLLFLIFLVPIIAFRIVVNVRLHFSMQECKKQGIELDLAKFIPPSLPPEENASFVIEDAIRAVIETQENLLSENDQYAKSIQEIFDRVGVFGVVEKKDIDVLRDAIQPYESGVAILSASSQLERARFDTNFNKPNPSDLVFPEL